MAVRNRNISRPLPSVTSCFSFFSSDRGRGTKEHLCNIPSRFPGRVHSCCRGGGIRREHDAGNEEKAALLSLSYSALLLLCPPLEMILHRRTRLDGAISPMKSILFLGPFSSFGRAAVGASLPPSVPRRRTGGEEEEARRNWEERRWEGRERGNSSGLNFQQSEREGGREGGK